MKYAHFAHIKIHLKWLFSMLYACFKNSIKVHLYLILFRVTSYGLVNVNLSKMCRGAGFIKQL